MNNTLFDFSKPPYISWGDLSLSLGRIAWYHSQGYKNHIITDFTRAKGAIHETLENYSTQKLKDRNDYSMLYNPLLEPVDFFKNIVVPTFSCEYYDIGTNFRTNEFPLEPKKYKFYTDTSSRNLREWVNSSDVKQFTYMLDTKLKTEKYKKVQKKLINTKNIVLYANWDDNLLYETNPARTRGHEIGGNNWDNLVSSVRLIDDYCARNPCFRLILFNKKAHDWSYMLNSNYYDMRFFEKKGLNFSQAFSLCVENSVATIGTWSSPQVWFNFAEQKNHIVYFTKQPWRVVRNLKYQAWNKAFTSDEIADIFSCEQA